MSASQNDTASEKSETRQARKAAKSGNGKIGKTVKPTGSRKAVPSLKQGWPKSKQAVKRERPISAERLN